MTQNEERRLIRLAKITALCIAGSVIIIAVAVAIEMMP